MCVCTGDIRIFEMEELEDGQKEPTPDETENDSVMEGIAVFALRMKNRITTSVVFNIIDVLVWLPYIVYVTRRDSKKEAVWVAEERRRTAELFARGSHPVKTIL